MAIEITPFIAPVYEDRYKKKRFSDKVSLIDADRYKHVVTYRVYQAIHSGEEHSKRLVGKIIDEYLYDDIFSNFECKAYIFCFSAPTKQVFRNHIAQEKKYKGNREGKEDKYFYEGKYEDMRYIYEYIESRYPTLLFDDLEADDILSMLQDPESTFIFSHDKDLKQVEGYHYNMERHVLEYTSKEDGFCMLVNQLLTGDTVDHIPGLPGFGPAALVKFQEECAAGSELEMLMMCIKKYTDKYGVMVGMDMFAEMWHLLSMRINRGAHCKGKYAKAFALMESLLKPVTDGETD